MQKPCSSARSLLPVLDRLPSCGPARHRWLLRSRPSCPRRSPPCPDPPIRDRRSQRPSPGRCSAAMPRPRAWPLRAAREARAAVDVLHGQRRLRAHGRDRRRPGVHRLDRRQALCARAGKAAKSGGSSPRRWASSPRPPCPTAGFSSAIATACSIASTPPRARSCGISTRRRDRSAQLHGDHVLFGSQDSYLYCLDAATGKLVWKYESADQIRCFPTIVDNLGFVAGCDGQLHVIDLAARAGAGARWTSTRPTGSSPAVLGEHRLRRHRGRDVPGDRPRHGEDPVALREQRARQAYRSSAAVTPEAVIVGSRDKLLHAFDPKSGRPLWTFVTKGRVDSSPVVVGERVYRRFARWPALRAGRARPGNAFGDSRPAARSSPRPPWPPAGW